MPQDPRLLNISYSSLGTFHECPRKFQLHRLNVLPVDSSDDPLRSLTFSYGHLVGNGIQMALQDIDEDEIIWKTFLWWPHALFEEDTKRKKSFWTGIFAIQQFIQVIRPSILGDWELEFYEGVPAVELSFVITLPGNFKYRGFVDAVLRNSKTQEIMVLEVKTTSASISSPAQYQNSAQAVGYSVVLDHIDPDLSSYEVLYLPFNTKDLSYAPLPFQKSYLQRALWLQELLLDTQVISLYEETGVYPMRGESCYKFYRDCEYFGLCTLPTSRLTKPLTPEEHEKLLDDLEKYQIKVSFQQLLETQISKSQENSDDEIL